MTPRAAAVVVAGAVLLTAGCASSGHPASPRTVYLQTMHKYMPNTHDRDLLMVGRLLCNGFDQGVSWATTVRLAVDSGIPKDKADDAVGAAIRALCPRNAKVIPSGG